MPVTKQCRSCGRVFPVEGGFLKPAKHCTHGVDAWCKPCAAEYQRDYKRRNQEHLAARRRELYAGKYGEHRRTVERTRAEAYPLRATAKRLQAGVVDRSRVMGTDVPAPLRTKGYFEEWLIRQPHCECCKANFRIAARSNGRPHDRSPSIDRFDPARAYELSNIRLICWRCNNIKRNYAAEDLIRVANWMQSGPSRSLLGMVSSTETVAPETIVVAGEEMSIRAAAKRFGFIHATLRGRLKSGWSVEDALSIPVDKRFSKQTSRKRLVQPEQMRREFLSKVEVDLVPSRPRHGGSVIGQPSLFPGGTRLLKHRVNSQEAFDGDQPVSTNREPTAPQQDQPAPMPLFPNAA